VLGMSPPGACETWGDLSASSVPGRSDAPLGAPRGRSLGAELVRHAQLSRCI